MGSMECQLIFRHKRTDHMIGAVTLVSAATDRCVNRVLLDKKDGRHYRFVKQGEYCSAVD